MVVLVMVVMCALGAQAAEAYACFTPSNTTLTFYYDSQRGNRSGTTCDLNTGSNNTDCDTDGTRSNVIDMRYMFTGCTNLHIIYVGNDWSTAAVEESDNMFTICTSLVGGLGTAWERPGTHPTRQTRPTPASTAARATRATSPRRRELSCVAT